MVATLILHKGAHRVSLDELARIHPPAPTRSWHPISHHRVLESVMNAIDNAGFGATRVDLGVSHDNHRLFGVLDLASNIVEGVSLAIGVRNSTDKSLPAGIVAGERVFVCDNLAFSATIVVMRKHTLRIEQELDQRIITGISKLAQFQENAAGRIKRLQQAPVNDAQAHDLIVRAVDNRCIGLRDLPNVLNEWRHPSHDAFQDRTAWSLHNAFTEIAKPRFDRNPTAAAAQTIRLNRLFTDVLGN